MFRTLAVGMVLALGAVACGADDDTSHGSAKTSSEVLPPELPQDFTWTGRYQVPDLDLEVPFTWHGAGGNFQMIAGSQDHPVHFTNLIYDGELYTLTYEWPEVPRMPCSHVGAFTIEEFNEGLADASFVGHQTHHDSPDRVVHHFRSTAVAEVPPELVSDLQVRVDLRIPLMAGDIYVDANDPTVFRKVLHFGLQNLYDPDLDEWLVIDEAAPEPGEVSLPEECAALAGDDA